MAFKPLDMAQHSTGADRTVLVPLVRARVKLVEGFRNKAGMLFDQLITGGVKPPDRMFSIHSFDNYSSNFGISRR
jgi:hypothetical protein